MLYQHISSKLIARLEKIEQGFIEQFSSGAVIENTLLAGDSRQANLLQHCKSRHRHLLCENYPYQRNQSTQICLGRFIEFPYAKESLDLIILSHILEFSNDPNTILSEACECLDKNGTLLLFSFSSSNSLDATKEKSSFSPISSMKVKQQLMQAGLEIIRVQSFFSLFAYATNSKVAQFIEKFITSRLPFLCNAYLIVAKKRIYPITPIRIKPYATPTFALALGNSCSSQQENV